MVSKWCLSVLSTGLLDAPLWCRGLSASCSFGQGLNCHHEKNTLERKRGCGMKSFLVFLRNLLEMYNLLFYLFFLLHLLRVTRNLDPPVICGLVTSNFAFCYLLFSVFTWSSITSAFWYFNWYFPACEAVLIATSALSLCLQNPLKKFLFCFSVLPGLGPAPGAGNYGARTTRQRPGYLPPGGYEVSVGLFSWQECRYKNKCMMLEAGFSHCFFYRAFGRVACNYCFDFSQRKSCLKKKTFLKCINHFSSRLHRAS